MNDDFLQDPTEQLRNLNHLPTIQYFQKTYGASLGGEDQKAVRLFKDYESQEKLRRLQFELTAIKDGKATFKACDRIIGKKRKERYSSYENWAKLMLLWIVQHKR